MILLFVVLYPRKHNIPDQTHLSGALSLQFCVPIALFVFANLQLSEEWRPDCFAIDDLWQTICIELLAYCILSITLIALIMSP